MAHQDQPTRRTITERRMTRTTHADGTTVQTSSTRVEVRTDRGVFMISVAAELAEMHPQTLRMYEARGLIEPKRSPKGTRLYSHKDVERLKRIQAMTAELGMNLAGVERVFELDEPVGLQPVDDLEHGRARQAELLGHVLLRQRSALLDGRQRGEVGRGDSGMVQKLVEAGPVA